MDAHSRAVKHAEDLEQSIAAARSDRLTGEPSLAPSNVLSVSGITEIASIKPTSGLMHVESALESGPHVFIRPHTNKSGESGSATDAGRAQSSQFSHGLDGVDKSADHWQLSSSATEAEDKELNDNDQKDGDDDDYEML